MGESLRLRAGLHGLGVQAPRRGGGRDRLLLGAAALRRGEVWWHEPPDAKRRPVLVLSREQSIRAVYDLIVCPATGTIRGLETEVELGPADGMPQSCVLNLANTTSAEKVMLVEPITELGSAKMDEVCRALAVATACG